jgi:hypothetical protein
LVEHRTENPCVGGSSPSISTKNPQHLPGVFVFDVSSCKKLTAKSTEMQVLNQLVVLPRLNIL